MNKNEGQPSGQNPEWESNREQNIAIAKRIDKLSLELPGTVDTVRNAVRRTIEDMQELQNTAVIEDLEEVGITIEGIPDYFSDQLAIGEMTIGHTQFVKNVNNPHRTIVLGVAYSNEAAEHEYMARGEVHEPIELLPEGFNYPVYTFKAYTDNMYDDSSEFDVSTIDGNRPRRVIGADGLIYDAYNAYCFNFFGQGLKIEDVSGGAPLERLLFNEEKMQLAQSKLKRIDYSPKEEDSRIVPLTSEDYAKINKMFTDIGAGLYKFRT